MPCWAPAEPDHQPPEGALPNRTRRVAPGRRVRRAGATPHPRPRRRGLPRPGEPPCPQGARFSVGSGFLGTQSSGEPSRARPGHVPDGQHSHIADPYVVTHCRSLCGHTLQILMWSHIADPYVTTHCRSLRDHTLQILICDWDPNGTSRVYNVYIGWWCISTLSLFFYLLIYVLFCFRFGCQGPWTTIEHSVSASAARS